MELIPIGLFAVVLWLVASSKGMTCALTVNVAMLPFGMLSAVNLPAVGGLSLKVNSVCAGLLLGWLTLEHLRSRDRIFSEQYLNGIHLSLLFLSIYVVISAVINVRIFQGEIDVFSLARGVERSGKGAIGMLTRLQPSSSNISQPFYMLLSIGFFFVIIIVIKKHGFAWIHRALLVAAGVHLTLGLLDAFALDDLLASIRTANYALLTHHQVHGFPRIIGGFAEPSAFGSFSTTLFAYFTLHTFFSKSWSSGLVALMLGLCVAGSFSSTAYFGGFFVVLVLGLAVIRNTFFGFGLPRGYIYIGWGVAVVVVVFLMLNTEEVEQILNTLIFDKAGSESGQERGLWANYGFQTFRDTYGLGAGVGSIRSNGWAAVYLGSMGIPGTCLALAFWLQVLFRPLTGELTAASSHIYVACKAAVLVSLMMKLASATTPDPGLGLMLFAACACGLRQHAQTQLELATGELRIG